MTEEALQAELKEYKKRWLDQIESTGDVLLEVHHLREALHKVDRELPDAIGGERQEISAAAAYAIRKALYGSGGPRPKKEPE